MDELEKMEIIANWAVAFYETNGRKPNMCPGGMELDYFSDEKTEDWYTVCLDFRKDSAVLELWVNGEDLAHVDITDDIPTADTIHNAEKWGRLGYAIFKGFAD